MLRSRRTHALVALALLAAPLFLFGDRALAIQDSEDKVWFGPVGIAPGERALVNIYAIGNPNEIGNPNDTPWNFVVRIFDRRGSLVQERPLQLAPGAIGSVELVVSDQENTTLAALSRRTFRAEIVGFNPQPDPPGKWAVTLEVVDRFTGRTSLLLGGPDTLPAAR
ncbi:MAG TPA: hypothetical protein VHJ77_10035 [Vicinamibacterales bacterium]|nr:hypothetical protein [Vicinamibacterales bacterium]